MTTSITPPNPVTPEAERQRRQRAWSAFVGQHLMGPINQLVSLSQAFLEDAGGERPDDYLSDGGKLRQAAQRLLDQARATLDGSGSACALDLEEDLRRTRHDLGNRLHQVSGMLQLLTMQEEVLFGSLLPDLGRMQQLCRDCEAKLLEQSGRGPAGNGTAEVAPNGTAGAVAAAEVAELVEAVQAVGAEVAEADALVGDILIADDDAVNREILRRLLESQGHRVVEAANGAAALRLLEDRPVDVLLLDIMMPEMNGFQVLQRLRAAGRLRRTAVIVVSALHEIHNLVRCLESGAEDYLTKPVDKALLRARIHSCLFKRRQRAHELEQFFPPEVVRQLLDRPDLLHTGRNADVTVLFCDIRGFSRVSERLRGTPEKMVQWVSAVMEAISECVLRHSGVLVDFIGDELLAMWGAPQAQPDHARRAASAALDMLACLPRLSAEWEPVIGEPTAVGIGLNSGPVSVGNTGTRRRFKYGPLGDTVNLASRIQGATKYLKARALLTQSTFDQLGDGFRLRRLANLQAVNIEQPVAVYELASADEPHWEESKDLYEQALTLYEAGPEHCPEAVRVLGGLVTRHGVSGANIFLMSRILGAMQDRSTWSPVYVLPGK